jgi:hypothetical protein
MANLDTGVRCDVHPCDFSDSNPDEFSFAEPNDFSDNLEPSDFPGNETAAAPPDFAQPDLPSENCDATYPSTACLTAQDLISLPADQIRNYGLSEKPDYVIERTLNILDPGNLTKVLQSISPEEISSIKNIITTQKFDDIISRIPEPQRNELVNSISTAP